MLGRLKCWEVTVVKSVAEATCAISYLNQTSILILQNEDNNNNNSILFKAYGMISEFIRAHYLAQGNVSMTCITMIISSDDINNSINISQGPVPCRGAMASGEVMELRTRGSRAETGSKRKRGALWEGQVSCPALLGASVLTSSLQNQTPRQWFKGTYLRLILMPGGAVKRVGEGSREKKKPNSGCSARAPLGNEISAPLGAVWETVQNRSQHDPTSSQGFQTIFPHSPYPSLAALVSINTPQIACALLARK